MKLNAMKKLSQKQLTDHVNLVKWQEQKPLEKFNLLTIHSLLLNGNSKFMQLKQKVQSFNSMIQKGIQRKHLQFEYTKKLYQLLRHLVNIKHYETQQEFLQNVYEWAKGGRNDFQGGDLSIRDSKSRPTTATTKTRAFSAYSRPRSGVSKIVVTRMEEPAPKIKQYNKTKTNVDYDKLVPGDIEFFTGQRTIHPNEQKPKKRLKQYQRKIFYDEEQDSDIQIQQAKEENPLFQLRTMNGNFLLKEEQRLQSGPQGEGQANQQGMENKEEGEENPLGDEQIFNENQDDVNLDDLPIQGEPQQEEPEEVVDKLKPRFKAFVKHETDLSQKDFNYVKGMKHYVEQRNQIIRKNQEDHIIKNEMLEWAKQKSRVKRQQQRRAQSARVVTKRIGIGFKNINQKQEENINVINLESIEIPQIAKHRPKTAFRAFNQTNRKELIKNCFIMGGMESHINKFEHIPLKDKRQTRITTLAERPNKKTFEEILREAEQKVKKQQDEEIINVKEKFARSKVPIQTNKIAKSVTYHGLGNEDDQYQEEGFSGNIIGINMLKNPFFKAGKKGKKGKKKKR